MDRAQRHVWDLQTPATSSSQRRKHLTELFEWSAQFACLFKLALRGIITIFKSSEIPSFSVGWYSELLVLEVHVSKLHLGKKKKKILFYDKDLAMTDPS